MNLVFDFGAVLFTWRPAILMEQYFPAQAATPAQAGQLAHAMFSHPDWHAFDSGNVEMGHVIARTAQRLQLDAAALTSLMHGIGEHLAPMPDSVELLARLHARRQGDNTLRLYYLSNMPVPYARSLEQRHDFLQWFDGGIFSGDVLHIKPDPAIYQLLQSRYTLEPAQTVFIDDLKPNVQAARAQGWHGIHFESAEQLQRQLTTQFGLFSSDAPEMMSK